MRNKPKLSNLKYFKPVTVIIIILMLVLGLQLSPAVAQSNQSAPVAIDGIKIFEVNNTIDKKAKDRAYIINNILQDAVNSKNIPEIKVEKGDNIAKILVGDNQQFTITSKDVVSGESPNEQAKKWADDIREKINRARKERSEEFISRTLIASFMIVALTAALHWVLGRVWSIFERNVSPLIHSEESSEQNQQQSSLNILLKATLFLTRTALWISISLYITNLFPLTRQWSYDIAAIIRDSLTSPIFKDFSITNILVLIGLFLGLIVVAGAVTNILRSRILRLLRISRGAQEVIAIVFKYTLIGIGSVVLLQIFGVDLSSLAILASALGVGIGFGFQDIAKNFGSGLVLLFERPIQPGDFIEVGKYMGTVETIGARSVTIRTLDRVSIIVPNSRFLEDEVINWSHHNPISRIHIPVGVSYSADVKIVKKALLEAGKNHPEVISVPQPQVLFTGFGDSSLDFELLVWIDAPSHQVSIKSDLCFRIEATLKQYHIEIPFPQRDLHLRTGELPVKLSAEVEQAILRQQNGHRA
ncbi:small-conductance mechanosensitive channel [Rivularia sp. PCC 7116]|uniref:mechanosensitive ion channel family protein n=1 Tax=Rivularia sp. PCC 7116 TaxID=373994 RepID=UPI00029EDD2D|nr:mechanosensitive ion channel domain-containing protein [Rivularia sp. PCC 7116]AFY52701.1 small-conductance mechanosensitive channel [Rivularia sp. PCC 7116]